MYLKQPEYYLLAYSIECYLKNYDKWLVMNLQVILEILG